MNIMQILIMNFVYALYPVSLYHIIIYWIFRKKRGQKLKKKYLVLSFIINWAIYSFVIFIIFSGNPMILPEYFHILFPLFSTIIVLYLIFNKENSTIDLFKNIT